jgi:hypothetical protein
MTTTENQDFVMGDPSGNDPYITYGSTGGMEIHNVPELWHEIARRQNEYDGEHGLPIRNLPED